jgi:hypothetical protein
MSAQPIDYAALAAKNGALSSATPAPSGGTVDYAALASKNGAITSTSAQPRGWLDSASDFAKEYWEKVNPVTAVEGLRDAAAHPIDTLKGITNSSAEVEKKAEEAFKRGNYVEGMRHALNYLLPVIGPQTDKAGDQAQRGEYAKSAGGTLGIGTAFAAPELIKNMPLPAGLKQAATGKAQELYQSALKPPVTNTAAKTAGMVDVGLEQGIPISKAGISKIADLVDDLNQKVTAEIKTQPTRMINKFRVASRLSDVADEFTNQVNPVKDLEAVSKSGNEFLQTQPKQITAEDAQALKVGTYKQVAGKYGELGNAAIESQKALARGLKEELANAFPELSKLNAREGQLLDLQPALERAVQRSGNHQMIGLGTPMVGAAAGAATGSLKVATALATMKAVLDNPMLKSRLAIALNMAGKRIPGGISMAAANARISAYSNLLGNAIQNQSGAGAEQTTE